MNKLRVGIIGLKRGMSFGRQLFERDDAEFVGACDHDSGVRQRFIDLHPDIKLFDSYEELIDSDIDAVVLASYCPDHAPMAVQALRAGKHVLSEVTAFHTLAQGVELCRTVESTGMAYMMAENTCYSPVVEEMKRIHHSGQTGQLIHAECEYVHDLRPEWKREEDGRIHWRLWQPCIYYCTHSLGPIFLISGDRPVSVVGIESGAFIEPSWPTPRADVGVALIQMASGATVKLLLSFGNSRGGCTHHYVVYGSKGHMETDRMNPSRLHVRLPENGLEWQSSEPTHPRLAERATSTGHGGIDFYALHDFIEAVRAGKLPPMDVYDAADMTLPGILAHRSAVNGSQPFRIPDFRQETERHPHENDHEAPLRDINQAHS
ncbi:MAG: Gfo/Idh/MocA family oxidoreductase [Planctomycetota bacterium]|nr:Gfo/Idh/MocA family oxidoreductase [Planctomycetota bacterium]MDA1137308.1 Gfo/Idh/MocA family oxidoreductase [Planctomycetota bacterium]